MLRPFLLRRTKAEVERQMPHKYEHVVTCRLSKRQVRARGVAACVRCVVEAAAQRGTGRALQRFLYDDFLSRGTTREALRSGNLLSVIGVLMQLRKVCNHPDLFEPRPVVRCAAGGQQRLACNGRRSRRDTLCARSLRAARSPFAQPPLDYETSSRAARALEPGIFDDGGLVDVLGANFVRYEGLSSWEAELVRDLQASFGIRQLVRPADDAKLEEGAAGRVCARAAGGPGPGLRRAQEERAPLAHDDVLARRAAFRVGSILREASVTEHRAQVRVGAARAKGLNAPLGGWPMLRASPALQHAPLIGYDTRRAVRIGPYGPVAGRGADDQASLGAIGERFAWDEPLAGEEPAATQRMTSPPGSPTGTRHAGARPSHAARRTFAQNAARVARWCRFRGLLALHGSRTSDLHVLVARCAVTVPPVLARTPRLRLHHPSASEARRLEPARGAMCCAVRRPTPHVFSAQMARAAMRSASLAS